MAAIPSNLRLRLLCAFLSIELLAPLMGANRSATAAQPMELVAYTPVAWGPIIQRTVGRRLKERFNVTLVNEDLLSAEMLTKLLAQKDNPEASVACPSSDGFVQGKAANLWGELDYSVVTNAKDIQKWATPDFIGNMGMVNSALGAVLEYNKVAFKEKGWAAPTSWWDIADPRYKGRVGLTSTTSGTAVVIFMFWSRLKGAPRGSIEPALEFSKRLVDAGQVHSFPTRSSEVNELMERGEIWIATTNSEAPLQLEAKGGPVASVFPKEGGPLILVECSVVGKGPNRRMANEFVNLMISEETQRELTLDRWIIPARKGLKLPPQYAQRLPLSEEKLSKLWVVNPAEMADFRPAWHDQFVKQVEQRKR